MRHIPELGDDIIDSRDIIERIAELENDDDEATGYCTEPTCTGQRSGPGSDDPYLCSDHTMEHLAWKDLQDQAQDSPDWPYGEALIRDSYFEEYARQLAEDIGAIQADASWPTNRIDWERAADDLKIDYFEVSADGYTYLIRA